MAGISAGLGVAALAVSHAMALGGALVAAGIRRARKKHTECGLLSSDSGFGRSELEVGEA